MKKNFYITTPIYYVNDVPHIGHAYTTILSDIIARLKRLDGYNVKFLTGTDEHGQKVEASAKKLNLDPQEFCDNTSIKFRELSQLLNISNDDFIRTTEDRHKKTVEFLWNKLVENNEIYLDKYSGWYSIRDEAFYSEDEISLNDKGERLAPTGAPVEWVEEPSYFFRLSKWQDKLLEFYESNPNFIQPTFRRNEVINFVKSGLKDLSVSRTSFSWGIKTPLDEKHVIYVWLDALTNYISALGYPNNPNWEDFWPADIHLIGKDILRFHAIYWPAFLMAAGIKPPKMVYAHGWWTNDGQKISKSLGNVINPFDLVEKYGQEYVRYYLAREVIIGNDGNFSDDNFKTRINSELVNKIGNLQQRTLAFIYKNLDGVIGDDINYQSLYINETILNNLTNIHNKIQSLIENYELNAILDIIVKISEDANLYIDKNAPWKLKSTDEKRMKQILYSLVENLRYLGILLQAFIPEFAGKMLDQLKISQSDRNFVNLSQNFAINPNIKIDEPVGIFNRL